MKFLHEVGTAGFAGAACAQLVLSLEAEGLPPIEHATMRHAILLVSEWMLLPSLLIVLVSGLFAMAAHTAYLGAGWAWIKAALTVLVLEGTLFSVQGPAQTAAEVSAEIAAGDVSSAEILPRVVRHERGGLGVILLLSVVNIALAVWRPRLRRRRAASGATATPESKDPAASASPLGREGPEPPRPAAEDGAMAVDADQRRAHRAMPILRERS